MKPLKLIQFGNPVLRETSKSLGKTEIHSSKVKELIKAMRYTLMSQKLGVGLAAPQVGQGLALAIVVIQPTAHRPDVEPFQSVLINPVITQTFGHKKQLWEGCISSGKGQAGLFAKVPRYSKIKVKFTDETGKQYHQEFTGLPAHVIQHEVDHLNNVLFVDRVKDTTSYMTYGEYLKRISKKRST